MVDTILLMQVRGTVTVHVSFLDSKAPDQLPARLLVKGFREWAIRLPESSEEAKFWSGLAYQTIHEQREELRRLIARIVVAKQGQLDIDLKELVSEEAWRGVPLPKLYSAMQWLYEQVPTRS